MTAAAWSKRFSSMGRRSMRGQNRVDVGWNLDGVDGRGEAIRAELADERFRLHEGAYTLLEEERVPFRLFD
jgi:hypothetical protein